MHVLSGAEPEAGDVQSGRDASKSGGGQLGNASTSSVLILKLKYLLLLNRLRRQAISPLHK